MKNQSVEVKPELSKVQKEVLSILNEGGKIHFWFNKGSEYYLDDKDGNSLNFRYSTFRRLNNTGCIEIKFAPSENCYQYGITDFAKRVFKF